MSTALLQVTKLSKAYGVEMLLDGISFVVNTGDRIGLIGPNGCGKTTLLRIIAGEETADLGSVALGPGIMPGYLPQGLAFAEDQTVGAVAWGAAYESARRAMRDLETRMSEASNGAMQVLLDAYTEASEQFEQLGGYDRDWRTETMLAHLGLDGISLNTPVGRLSGGQQTRLGLAQILLAEPPLLLLDEPTNHLDLDALNWLEEFLASYPGALLIVSHDRVFLDRTVNRILAFDPGKHTIKEYPGNYSDYAEASAHEQALQWQAFRDQEAEIRRMQADIVRTKEQAKWVERTTTPREPGVRRYAKKVAKKALSREKKLDRFLDSDERIERPRSQYHLKLDFGMMPRGGQEVLTLDGLGHSYGGEWLFRDTNIILHHGERIAVLGPNGSGKSTLLKCIAGELVPAEGEVRIGANVRIGYMPQGQEGLEPDETPLSMILRTRPMSETDARSLLHYFLFAGDDVFVPVRSLSYGQRARLLLAQIVTTGANCLILDEPLNHLDIPSRERFEEALATFPGTVLVTGHDRAFIDRFATGVWSLEEGAIRRYIDRDDMLRKPAA
jgi:ATP-binding cassette subfamily F protein 3